MTCDTSSAASALLLCQAVLGFCFAALKQSTHAGCAVRIIKCHSVRAAYPAESMACDMILVSFDNPQGPAAGTYLQQRPRDCPRSLLDFGRR